MKSNCFKFAALAAAALAVVPAMAQTARELAVSPRPEVLRPLRAWRVDRNLRPIGPAVDLTARQRAEVPSWANGYDGLNSNPAAIDGFGGGHDVSYYGMTSTDAAYGPGYSWWFGWVYTAPYQVNDVRVNPPYAQTSAQYSATVAVWNPLATNPASGSLRCLTFVGNSNYFDRHPWAYLNPAGPATGIASSDDLYGVILDWGVVPGGFYIWPADLSGTNLGFPLPRSGNGSSSWIFLTVDGSGNIAPLTGTQYAYQAFNNWCSPGDAAYPGTNPSSSSQWEYDDDFPPDYTMTPAEYYDYGGYAGPLGPLGTLSLRQSMFVDDNRAKITGSLGLGDVIGAGGNRQITSALFQMRDAGGNQVDEQLVAIGPNGEFELLIDPLSSTPVVEVSVKVRNIAEDGPGHWCRITRPVVAGMVIFSQLTEYNGDATNDNFIDSDDFDVLVANFGGQYDSPNNAVVISPWDFGADFNNDDFINSDDFDILVANFGKTGDN